MRSGGGVRWVIMGLQMWNAELRLIDYLAEDHRSSRLNYHIIRIYIYISYIVLLDCISIYIVYIVLLECICMSLVSYF